MTFYLNYNLILERIELITWSSWHATSPLAIKLPTGGILSPLITNMLTFSSTGLDSLSNGKKMRWDLSDLFVFEPLSLFVC